LYSIFVLFVSFVVKLQFVLRCRTHHEEQEGHKVTINDSDIGRIQ